MKMKYIAIFCSALDLDKKYSNPACKFAHLLAENGFHLVWGGSDTGLMKQVASAFQEKKRKLIGVSVTHFRNVARKNADEMIFTKNLAERKLGMLKRCDAIAVLPGGTGTLDEASDIIELKKVGDHEKPIVFLNTRNYYEGLKLQLKRMQLDGFLDGPISNVVHFSNTPEKAVEYLGEELGIKNRKDKILKNQEASRCFARG